MRAKAWLMGVGVVAYFVVIVTVGIPCVFHELTGLFCPGCGGTRAMWRVIEGDFGGAVRQNGWLIVVVVPWLAFLGAVWIIDRKKGNRKLQKVSEWVAYVGVGLTILFMVTRNVPMAAFDILRPY